MKNVVAYCRVSTDGQVGDDKFGIDSQKEQIVDYCARNDMQISAWYIDEGISGAKEERPEFDKILFSEDSVENPPIEAVVVAKSDRVARDINIYYYYKMLLRKKDVQTLSAFPRTLDSSACSAVCWKRLLCVLPRWNVKTLPREPVAVER